MNRHLAEISQSISVSATALLILDGAGWHSSPKLIVPENIVLLPLPPYAPELNSDGKHLGISARQFPKPLRVGHLRRHRRCLLRCLESAHGEILRS